jgi:hypothetical protein
MTPLPAKADVETGSKHETTQDSAERGLVAINHARLVRHFGFGVNVRKGMMGLNYQNHCLLFTTYFWLNSSSDMLR